MTYYRVKEHYDNVPRYKIVNGRRVYDSCLIGKELYTPAERAKFTAPERTFDIVEISRKKTYFFFGTRYAME